MLDKTKHMIRDHNRSIAEMWNSGGLAYDQVSFAISDALAHTAQRLFPRRGEHVLDIATGTGWTARNCARMGAKVSAVDIAPDLISAAKSLSAGFEPPIGFHLADAEALPFETGIFDGVISTFGVMFAGDHHSAADEIKRVIKPGGRMALATWVPNGSVAEFFGIISSHSDAPLPEQSPLAWGDPDHIKELFGDCFKLTFEYGTNNAYHASEDAIWNWYIEGFGPLSALCASLAPEAIAKLKISVDDFHRKYRVEAGLHVKRDYLVTIATRL